MSAPRLFPSDSKTHPKNRFSKHAESKTILDYLSQLQDKKAELKISADKEGDESIDFRKFKIVDRLISELDAKIDKFNKSPILQDDKNQEDQAYLDILKDLHDHTSYTKFIFFETLNKPRSYQLRLTRNAVDVVEFGAPLATVAASGSLVALPVAFAAMVAIDSYSDALLMTNTNKLIYNFLQDLDATIKYLGSKLEQNADKIKKSLSTHVTQRPSKAVAL